MTHSILWLGKVVLFHSYYIPFRLATIKFWPPAEAWNWNFNESCIHDYATKHIFPAFEKLIPEFKSCSNQSWEITIVKPFIQYLRTYYLCWYEALHKDRIKSMIHRHDRTPILLLYASLFNPLPWMFLTQFLNILKSKKISPYIRKNIETEKLMNTLVYRLNNRLFLILEKLWILKSLYILHND